MRLGDLDDLKVHISELMLVYSGEELANAILNAIDNASTVPQVTVFTETADEKAVADLKAELQSVIEEKPQGEWVEKEDTPASVYYCCSNCNMEGIPVTPYCPWCGAEMKGN